jgi:hypothetical protein
MTELAGVTEVPAGVKAWLGCVLAGGVALGLGSRVVMRVIAMMAEPRYQGATTGGGNVVGEITIKGTVGMIVPGMLGGAIGGAL